MPRPLLVVGDVQGDAERLVEALAEYPEDEVDTVFLGDFFQGGPPGAAGGARSLAEVWLWRRGDWADLRAVADDAALEAWLRHMPLMLLLDDGTLVQHYDDDAYARLGDDVDTVNARAREALAEPGGAWTVFWHTVGRRAFDDDPDRLERHLARFGARRLVHGHTPHRGDRPAERHGGRLWGFDGCFSRFWNHDGSGAGPVSATVALLPALDGVPRAERPAGRDPRESPA